MLTCIEVSAHVGGMPVDVQKILEQARQRQSRAESTSETSSPTSRKWWDPLWYLFVWKCNARVAELNNIHAYQTCSVVPRSYDSSKEDAQNPFPEYEETPPGKRTFQSKKAGREPLRVDSVDTLVVETPPPKLKRPRSTDLSGSLSKKVRHALRRPQTVDQKTGSERKADATKAQKKLEAEFEEADSNQGSEDADTTAKAATKGNRASPKAKAKAKAKNKARVASSNPKATKADHTPTTKPSKDSENEKQAPTKTKPNEDSGKTPATKPSEKADSKANAKAKPTKDSGKTAPNKPSINNESETEEPRDKKARSSKDPMPKSSPKKSSKNPGAKPVSPETSKANKKDRNEQEEPSIDEKKKIAHRMYMRFYRSVHSHSVAFCSRPEACNVMCHHAT